MWCQRNITVHDPDIINFRIIQEILVFVTEGDDAIRAKREVFQKELSSLPGLGYVVGESLAWIECVRVDILEMICQDRHSLGGIGRLTGIDSSFNCSMVNVFASTERERVRLRHLVSVVQVDYIGPDCHNVRRASAQGSGKGNLELPP